MRVEQQERMVPKILIVLNLELGLGKIALRECKTAVTQRLLGALSCLSKLYMLQIRNGHVKEQLCISVNII